MTNDKLLKLLIDFINERGKFQNFIEFCEDCGEDQAEIEDAIDEFEINQR